MLLYYKIFRNWVTYITTLFFLAFAIVWHNSTNIESREEKPVDIYPIYNQYILK